MSSSAGRTPHLERAAEIFLQLRTVADPRASELLAGEPPEVTEGVELLLAGCRSADTVSALYPGERFDADEGLVLEPGERLGDFEVIELLGRAGMGEVYRAVELSLGRDVALKVMRSRQAALPGAGDRFRFEAETASQVDHPAICKVYSIGEHEGLTYIAMQLIHGRKLAEVVDAGPALEQSVSRRDMRQRARVMQTVAEALHRVHERGVVHRDVKPDNIMIWGAKESQAGEPVILDFGVARLSSEVLGAGSGSVQTAGTPTHMAPEQVPGPGSAPRVVDRRTDVYALGVTLYELCTGHLPHEVVGDQPLLELWHRIRSEAPLLPRDLNPAVPLDLQAIIVKAIAKSPEDRYQTAEELGLDLGRFLRHESVHARRAPAAERVLKFCRRYPWVCAVVFLGLAAGGLAWKIQRLEGTLHRLAEASTRSQDASLSEEERLRGQREMADTLAPWDPPIAERITSEYDEKRLGGRRRGSPQDAVLLEPRKSITATRPAFRFLVDFQDRHAHDIVFTLRDMGDWKYEQRLAASELPDSGEVVLELPPEIELGGDGKLYRWTAVPTLRDRDPEPDASPAPAFFRVVGPDAVTAALSSFEPSGSPGLDCIRRGLLLLDAGLVLAAHRELEGVPDDAADVERELARRLDLVLRAELDWPIHDER